MNEEQFNVFYDELMKAEVVKPKDFEEKFFEGCMPFEEMARRGKQTLLFGPMKPVGLTKPDGTKPYAVVQLRQDNVQASLYNIVGFQTHLTWPEQRRIIHLILQDYDGITTYSEGKDPYRRVVIAAERSNKR